MRLYGLFLNINNMQILNPSIRLFAGETTGEVCTPQPNPQAGLTLVEMLIALVLSSIIFISAYQVISNLVQYQVRARAGDNRQMDYLLLTNIVSQIIEKSLAQNDLYSGAAKNAVFRGRRDSLQLLSRAYSERYDSPGHRVYRLFKRDGELYLHYQAYDENYLDNQQFELATGLKVEDLRFEYYVDGDWVDEWLGERSIPAYIRTVVEFSDTRSADLIRGSSRR